MLTDKNFTDLKVKGYTVVTDVLTGEECDQTVAQYREWLSQFKDGEWPFSVNSLIQRYNAGNMHPTWFARLKSKKVFAQVWKTDKLLSSIDAIAIGRPPENGEEQFGMPGDHWLHLDQNASRDGLHAYQGAVYLETADEDDWTLHVLEGSHLQFSDFYENNTRACMRSEMNNYYSLLDEEVQQMKSKGCILKRVPVPKGGMVLWDSRTVHANASPLKGRKKPGRWRFCVFVSMTPAIWATEEDMKKKKEAYEKACMTTHWSSQGVMFFKTSIPSFAPQDVEYPTELPEIAKSREAKLISGALRYDFHDGEPTGEEFKPTWRKRALHNGDSFELDKRKLLKYGIASLAVVAGIIIFKMSRK
ncbi:uncharacterized protein LOC123526179 [Mercenaria mercenaria]|uniref:uncharacterized protein LOC123526179 n=1 Tax=Mercenaria mercenaria TaxID=6596 RepID=UPI00234E4A96|nr:uncharacterized protein LOC123526179 [Mercenaria mercenaria]XP_053378835.1 uncharacterized protein LOC123526179 [Mercenaria mercenaria]